MEESTMVKCAQKRRSAPNSCHGLRGVTDLDEGRALMSNNPNQELILEPRESNKSL